MHPELGFFSVVQKPGDAHLTVRARFDLDLDRLREGPMPALSPSVTNNCADYRFRATVSHEEFAAGLAAMGRSLNYSNVKARAAEVDGHDERYAAYRKVWAALYSAQEAQRRRR